MSKPSGFSTYDIMDYEHGGGSFGPAKEQVRMAWTNQNFEALLTKITEWERLQQTNEAREDEPVDERILAALKIAAAVMRPGVIEAEVHDDRDVADAIRKALTDG